ncbi:hypothetical protein D2122_21415 [Salmonella enterica subsp. enterica serovar Weslaco]|uniref:Trimeric autotransporter adhesin YadA-like C-terminal membrane anchor domain-containing protein n=1 Tax=Salmonella enterica subsp. enterica serovar Weslaco TaxID=1243597 RepID=A0A5X3P5D8_SALET|nr:hypothetical protein [Salmonella enterica subsp. enterica serovar Weslaco]EBZ6053870.1 hypothetical protein [Salmonella enterica subsp. enterica serovar Weslaco]EBZ6062572.1 hypothetical protein [Salmonella enterica subsp. enterica serovar Weslaco]EBZ6072406.1 hypothetical protein [Salmonella enterica subsp. enterica serovar Weslaco]EBZ6077233.1 hypothetical protein [Salmonella enterica subsp. enterica serovar Weslaco]
MQSLFKAISLTGIEFLFLQALGFPRKKFYHEENILENQIIHFSLPFCHARFLKSTNFSPLVLALSLYSNIVHASEIQSNDATQYGLLPISTSGSNSVSFGAHTFTGNNSTAVGQQASAGNNSTAIGSFSYANDGSYSTAIGDDARATGDSSTALGERTRATGKFSTAIGSDSKAISSNSTATGQGSRAIGELSTATGQNAQAKGKNSVALGANSVADKENQVSIGQKITDATTGAVSYITRTLSNLTDGTDAHDAVNKGQLDTAKSDAISTANQYTDRSITGLKLDEKLSTADSNAQKYATSAQTAANKHTDDEIGRLDTKAQGYATTAQSAAEKYTDNATLQANQKVLQKANTYTDNTAKDVLKSANDNTERRAAVAEDNAIKRSGHYTDERSVQTLNSANTYTNHRAIQAENNAVARSNNYTDNRFGELRKSMKHTEKRLNAGIAGVTALSSIPYSSGNNFSYGIGVGNYQNGNAVAAGVQFRASPSTNVRLNISWDSAGNNATGIGIAGGW